MKKARGFTLIEVLIAMTLLSIMSVLLFASLKICADSWEKGESKINQVNKNTVIYNFFQRQLSTARPLWNESNPNERNFVFQGKDRALQFVSGFPASANRAGLQLFTIGLEEKENDLLLKVKIVPFFNTAKGQKQRPEEIVILNRVAQFALSYFGSEDGMSDPAWFTEWLDKDRQPLLVKINLAIINDETDKADDILTFPEMIIAMKMQTDNSMVENQEELLQESNPENSDENMTEPTQ